MDASNSDNQLGRPNDIYSGILNTGEPPTWTASFPSREKKAPADSPACCVCQRLQQSTRLLEINEAVSSGCEHCKILYDGILQFVPARLEDQNYESYMADISVEHQEHHRYLKVSYKASCSIFLEIFTTDDAYSGCRSIAAADLVQQPCSPEFFNTIRGWAEECINTHGPCIRNIRVCHHLLRSTPNPLSFEEFYRSPPLLPARVLDLQGTGSSKVSLKETNGERAPYITLSHCWGSIQPLITTTSTLHSHKDGVEWPLLPKSFQDAITITRGLDIRYIWIDSLCIVQDDEEDWAAESVKMGTIYENSYLTIAATAATDGTNGCFTIRDSEAKLRHSHQIRAPAETQQAIYVRQSPGSAHEGLGPEILGYGNEMPLNGRGWVLQERLLSRRVLNMCGEEMVWECNTHTKCECTKLGEFYASFKHSFSRIVCNEVAHPSVFIEMWDLILARYLARSLTFQKDRLTAIEGVAQKLVSTRPGLGKCVVGHWEAWLLAGLLWFVGDDGIFMHDGRDTGSKAPPTWSWASLKGCWQYGRVPIERGFPTILVNTSWRMSSSTEDFPKTTWIQLKGPFLPAKLEYTQSSTDSNDKARFRAQNPRLLELDEEKAQKGFAVVYVDTILESQLNPLLPGAMVYLLEVQTEEHFPGDPVTGRGLILRPHSGEISTDSFERVGIFYCRHDRFKDAEVKAVILV